MPNLRLALADCPFFPDLPGVKTNSFRQVLKIAPAPQPNDTMERLKISTSVGLFRVPTDDIAYIEASGNYCDVHLFNGESVTMTFQLHYFVEVLGMLQQNFFLRVGKSLIVNKNFVYSINVTNQELKLMDYRAHRSFRLKASKEALKELKSVLELEHK